jgi:peptidoglycan/xylan/chitin deacetylase (PgdA/CDA1 family)
MSFRQFLKNSAKFPLELLANNMGQHRQHTTEPRLWVMMYHRILPKYDPRYILEEPGMMVEPDTFQMHLQILKQEFTIIPLSEWINRKNQNLSLPEKACAITFDDGWLDNFEYALPILEKEQVPATFFAVSHMIGTNEQFWPNRIVSLLQQPESKIQSIPWLQKLTGNQTADAEVSAQAIYSLKDFSDDYLLKLIEQAEKDLSISPSDSPSLMDWEQLRLISNNDLMEVGSHTCHHIRLRDNLDLNIQLREITESKVMLEKQLGKPVNLFCYPNGDYSEAAVKAVSEHYQAAVTTRSGINHANSFNPFKLHRLGVHQDISNNRRKLLARIAQWP